MDMERLNERLNELAKSVNGAALRAQGMVSSVVLAALYILWSLVSSTDESLFLNRQLLLGQWNIGLSLEAIYIVGPMLLFFLHVSLLFLWRELRWRVERFELVLSNKMLGVGKQFELYPGDKKEETREELLGRLSTSVLVKSLRTDSSWLLRRFSDLTVVLIPWALLFAIDITFVRYQSDWITTVHHCLVIFDLAAIAWFRFYSQRWPEWCTVTSDSDIWARLRTCIRRCFQSNEEESSRSRCRKGALRAGATILRAAFMVFLLYMLLDILRAASPPDFNSGTVEGDRKQIWRDPDGADGSSELRQAMDGILDVVFKDENFVDSVLCPIWDRACRYLDVSTMELARMTNRELQARKRRPRGSGTIEDEDGIDRFHIDVLDLNSRNLRFAKLESTWLHGASFIGADLRGATLEGANLQGHPS